MLIYLNVLASSGELRKLYVFLLPCCVPGAATGLET